MIIDSETKRKLREMNAAELLDALKNFFRLQLQIFLIVKSDLCHVLPRISKFQQTACEKTKHAAIILS